MSDFNSEVLNLNSQIIEAHNKHYLNSPTGLVNPKESPNENIIYHLYSMGSFTSQKGGWAYLQRSEFEQEYDNSACKHLNLKFPKVGNGYGKTYVILTKEECILFRNKMIDLLKKYKYI